MLAVAVRLMGPQGSTSSTAGLQLLALQLVLLQELQWAWQGQLFAAASVLVVVSAALAAAVQGLPGLGLLLGQVPLPAAGQ